MQYFLKKKNHTFDKIEIMYRLSYNFLLFTATRDCAVGSASHLALGRSQVRFPGPAHSFISCQLLVKG